MEPEKENKTFGWAILIWRNWKWGWHDLSKVFKARLKLQSPEMTCPVKNVCDHKSKSKYYYMYKERTNNHFWDLLITPGSPASLSRIPLAHISWDFFHSESYRTPLTTYEAKILLHVCNLSIKLYISELSWNWKYRKALIFSICTQTQ